MFDVIIIVLREMKHLANLCDGRIKHNEIHGRQAFGNTFGFPLVLRLFHFRHQVVRPGKHRTARADCFAVGILGKEITIGIGGVVTFKNAKKVKETVAEIPLTSIVLETDCPYLAPEPFRGKRNQSAYIQYVAEKIAEIKEISYEEVVAQTEKNARAMYGLDA